MAPTRLSAITLPAAPAVSLKERDTSTRSRLSKPKTAAAAALAPRVLTNRARPIKSAAARADGMKRVGSSQATRVSRAQAAPIARPTARLDPVSEIDPSTRSRPRRSRTRVASVPAASLVARAAPWNALSNVERSLISEGAKRVIR
jgi:hypothetical protein